MKKHNLNFMSKLHLALWMILFSIAGKGQIQISEGTTIVIGSGVYVSALDGEENVSIQVHHFESKVYLENSDNQDKSLKELLAETSSENDSFGDSLIETKKTEIAKVTLKSKKPISPALVNDNKNTVREVKLHSLPAQNSLYSEINSFSPASGSIVKIKLRTIDFNKNLNLNRGFKTYKINTISTAPLPFLGIEVGFVTRPPPYFA